MKYSNRFVIYYAAIHYLKEEELTIFNETIKIQFIRTNLQFLKILYKFLDIELFKTKPHVWQDIWVYNHIKYEKLSKKSKLLKQYETEVLIPD